jgi:hypothetical protein
MGQRICQDINIGSSWPLEKRPESIGRAKSAPWASAAMDLEVPGNPVQELFCVELAAMEYRYQDAGNH